MLHLWIGKDFIELVDWPRRNALLLEPLQPFCRGSGFEDPREQGSELRPVTKPQVECRVLRRFREFGPLESDAKRAPLSVAAHAYIDETVGSFEYAHWRRIGMIVSCLSRDHA